MGSFGATTLHVGSGCFGSRALWKYTQNIEKQSTGLNLRKLYDVVNGYEKAEKRAVCNEKLGLAERHSTGTWDVFGYAAEAYPGIQQALDEGDFEVAQEQLELTSERIESAAQSLAIIDMHDPGNSSSDLTPSLRGWFEV